MPPPPAGTDPPATIRLSEVLAAVSLASDVGHDQPLEKSLRNAVIATRLGMELGLGREDLSDTYYVALLRSMGCTANAHESAALFGGDDRAIAGLIQVLDSGDPRAWVTGLSQQVQKSLPDAPDRPTGWYLDEGRRAELEAGRAACGVARTLAARLRLSAGVQTGLDERYDGRGAPDGEELCPAARLTISSTSSRSSTGPADPPPPGWSPTAAAAGTSTRRSSTPSTATPTPSSAASTARTSAQRERVRLHSYYTERILARTPAFAHLATLAGSHHERVDGSGYHRGVPGDALTPAMRLLACADVYVALTPDRPHRPALPAGQAAAALRETARAGALCPEATEAVLAAAGHQPAPRPAPPCDLTEREVEVLGLLARGLTKQADRRPALRLAAHRRPPRRPRLRQDRPPHPAGAAMFAVEHRLLGGQRAVASA